MSTAHIVTNEDRVHAVIAITAGLASNPNNGPLTPPDLLAKRAMEITKEMFAALHRADWTQP